MKPPDPVLRLALAALLLAAQGLPASAADTVVGSGTLQTETRTITGFQAVALRGAMNLVLRQGASEGVEIRADHNLLPLIETRVVDRAGLPTLEIGGKNNTSWSTRNEMTVTVSLISLKAMTVSGSGDTSCERLKTDALKVSLSGSGNLKLGQLDADALDLRLSGSGDAQTGGTVVRIELAISGSGNADLQHLQADDASVRIAGSGDASVHARRALTVAIAGSGDLSYAGEPTVKSSISGSGSVKRLRTR